MNFPTAHSTSLSNFGERRSVSNLRRPLFSVIFHVATLMPTKETDPNCNAKKLHIGNDYVTIVYNNSNQAYKIGTIKV